ncbi:hypothetical protein GH733_009906 [Mirounga leonina]|nr:hypothetical protein GH733_009906 [Mirounga leonina]
MLMKQFLVVYGEKPKLKFAGPPAMVEPYNSFLITHMTLDHSHCAFMVTQEAIYDICQCNLDIIHTNLNHLIGRLCPPSPPLRNLTVPECEFDRIPNQPGPIPPYPLSPGHLLPSIPAKAYVEQLSAAKITNACFKPASQMAKYDPCHSKYMVCSMWYRGGGGVDTPTSTQPLPASG